MIIEHIEILKQHNHWRRCNDENCDCKMVNVKKLGCAIDAAIDVMQECSDADAKLKIAIEALQGLIASVKGYRKNIQDNQPCDAEVFAKQALEKIGK